MPLNAKNSFVAAAAAVACVSATATGQNQNSDPTTFQLRGAEVDVASMWKELDSHCAAGLCGLHSGSKSKLPGIANTTDCKGRLLAYEFALNLIPDRAPQREVFDALELADTCGVTPPKAMVSEDTMMQRVRGVSLPVHATDANTFYVDPIKGNDSAAGSKANPFKTVFRALKATRSLATGNSGTIVLEAGTHFLSNTVQLGTQDSGLTITADPDAPGKVWLSGGAPISPKWVPWAKRPNVSLPVWSADLSSEVKAGLVFRGLNTLQGGSEASGGSYSRVTRARYPDGSFEECSGTGTGGCWNNGIKHWHKDLSCVGLAKTVYKDLRVSEEGKPCKNTSAMWDTYNTYSNGHGGCCEVWSGDNSPYGPMGNYFCGNSSAGGWVGYNDPRGNNKTQGLSPALPVGFTYDETKYPFLETLADPAGAVFHVWRDQGWFVNMFEVASHDKGQHAVEFSKVTGRDGRPHVKGGWQGGRGWQVNASAINSTAADEHDYLLASKWMIENVIEALDAPGEYFFDQAQSVLYFYPNVTSLASDVAMTNMAPPTDNLVVVQLETLISVNATMKEPAKNITITGLNIRDAADVVLEPWGVPSGGDWGLYRGGAVFLEGCEGCMVSRCLFERIDGNGIFLSGYTRNTQLTDNEFSWIGLSAMAAWGYTNEDDGTDGQQPRFTELARNYVREIGLIEKQSSMWFQAKACQSDLHDNIAFNGPRAGVNFNDGFGGGTTVVDNLIFNQCRESGDHGPINSWDRTSYLSDVAYGVDHPSYDAAMNEVHNNMIIANYGSSQGFDTDDGSSFYNISDNFMFLADAWKMDYGGHDYIVTGNVVYHGANDGQNCFNSWPFLPGNGAEYRDNICVLPKSTNLGNLFHGCDCPGHVVNPPWTPGANDPQSECGVAFSDNKYFTENGTAKVSCGNGVSWADWQKGGADTGSTLSGLPSDDELLGWARAKLKGV